MAFRKLTERQEKCFAPLLHHPLISSSFDVIHRSVLEELSGLEEADFCESGRANFGNIDGNVLSDTSTDLTDFLNAMGDCLGHVLSLADVLHWKDMARKDSLLVCFFGVAPHEDAGISVNRMRLLLPVSVSDGYILCRSEREPVKLTSRSIIQLDEWTEHAVLCSSETPWLERANIFLSTPDPFLLSIG